MCTNLQIMLLSEAARRRGSQVTRPCSYEMLGRGKATETEGRLEGAGGRGLGDREQLVTGASFPVG